MGLFKKNIYPNLSPQETPYFFSVIEISKFMIMGADK